MSSLLRNRVEGLKREHGMCVCGGGKVEGWQVWDLWVPLCNQDFLNYGEWVSLRLRWQGIIFISQPLLQGYFCRRAITVVGVEVGGYRMLWYLWSKYLKNKNIPEREAIIYFAWLFFPFSKTCQENLLPSFFRSLSVKGQIGDKTVGLSLQRFMGLLCLLFFQCASGGPNQNIPVRGRTVFRKHLVTHSSRHISTPWKQDMLIGPKVLMLRGTYCSS